MSSQRPLDYWLLWIVALASLILNLVIIKALLDTKQQVSAAAGIAAQSLRQLRSGSIDYTVAIDEQMPVSLTIKYAETLTVPISTSIPVQTNLTGQISTFLGAIPFNVPVDTSFPVNVNPSVPLNVAIPVSASVPVKMDVPIHIDLATTPLGSSLGEVEAYLQKVAEGK
jgi:hypothetical protein